VSAVSLGQKPTPLSTPQLDPATHLRTKTDRLHYIGREKSAPIQPPEKKNARRSFKEKRSELCSELEEFA